MFVMFPRQTSNKGGVGENKLFSSFMRQYRENCSAYIHSYY